MVPAELFGLLGEQIEMRGDALYLGGVPNAFTGEADETNAFNIVCKDKTLDKGAWKTAWLWCRSVRSAKPSATP